MRKTDMEIYSNVEFIRFNCPYCEQENNIIVNQVIAINESLKCISCEKKIKADKIILKTI